VSSRRSREPADTGERQLAGGSTGSAGPIEEMGLGAAEGMAGGELGELVGPLAGRPATQVIIRIFSMLLAGKGISFASNLLQVKPRTFRNMVRMLGTCIMRSILTASMYI
jgi:hypothetical protein